jgi:tetratricopeptide (TPR) repeat protein
MSNPMKATAEGSFQKTPFANVLLYARERKMSGSIVVTIPSDDPDGAGALDVAGTSTIILDQGGIVALQTPSQTDNLPWVLHEQGAIDEDTFVKVQEALQQNPRADEVGTLLRLRAADMLAIDRGQRELARRRVLGLFGIAHGGYAYYANVDLLKGVGRLRAAEDVLPLVWRAYQRHAPDDAAVAAVIDKLGPRLLRLRAENEFERFEFGEEVGLAATQLRSSPCALEQLAGLSPDPTLVRRMVYLLALTKQVEVIANGPAAATSLSIPPPSIAPGPARPPPVPAVAIVSRAPPAVSAAPPVSVPSGPQSPESAEPAPQAEAPTAAEDPAEHPKHKEAVALLARLENKNYYAMFELSDGASVDDVRAAFPRIAAPWHPDRAPAPALATIFEQVFAMYNTAHATLTDKSTRAAYEETLHGGGGTPAAQKKVAQVLDTVQDVHRAEIAMKRRELGEAERLLRRVVDTNQDDIGAALLLAQCLLEADPTRHADEVIGLMAKLLPLTDNQNDRAFLWLGVAVKTKGDTRRAHASFKRALELNPNNVEASRELRIIEMRLQQKRDEKAAEKSLGGLFNKFLKR